MSEHEHVPAQPQTGRRRSLLPLADSLQQLIRGRLSKQLHGYDTDWLDRYEPYGRVGYSMLVYRFGDSSSGAGSSGAGSR